MAGKRVGRYNDQGKQIDLALYAHDGMVDTREQLAAIPMVTPSGDIVRLDDIATVTTTTGPTTINHVEKERAITLKINLTPETALEEAIVRLDQQVFAPARSRLPINSTIRLAGTADKLNSTLATLTSSFGLAVL